MTQEIVEGELIDLIPRIEEQMSNQSFREALNRLMKVDREAEDRDFEEALEQLAKIFRILEGKPLDSDSVITRLTDPKEILERSRYPTYSILSLAVYLRLIYKFNDNAKSCLEWSNTLSKAMISYKGKSREEWVEQLKVQNASEQQFIIGDQRATDKPMKRSRFWNRPKKQAEPQEIIT